MLLLLPCAAMMILTACSLSPASDAQRFPVWPKNATPEYDHHRLTPFEAAQRIQRKNDRSHP